MDLYSGAFVARVRPLRGSSAASVVACAAFVISACCAAGESAAAAAAAGGVPCTSFVGGGIAVTCNWAGILRFDEWVGD